MSSQVRCGPRCVPQSYQWIGKQVQELRRFLAGDLQVPDGAPATVSRDGGMTSVSVREDYKVQHGDLLEFIRPPGTKGVRILVRC
jgi:hypothetical protein